MKTDAKRRIEAQRVIEYLEFRLRCPRNLHNIPVSLLPASSTGSQSSKLSSKTCDYLFPCFLVISSRLSASAAQTPLTKGVETVEIPKSLEIVRGITCEGGKRVEGTDVANDFRVSRPW